MLILIKLVIINIIKYIIRILLNIVMYIYKLFYDVLDA